MTASAASLAALARWAEADSRVVAAALVGSHARGEARPDSDVDVVLLSPTPDAFFEDTTWLTQLGVVAQQQEERWGRVRTLRVWLDDGTELELNFAPADWARAPLDPATRRVIDGGLRVLFDRAGAFAALR